MVETKELKTEQISTKVTLTTKEKLDRFCEAEKLTQSDALSRILEEKLANKDFVSASDLAKQLADFRAFTVKTLVSMDIELLIAYKLAVASFDFNIRLHGDEQQKKEYSKLVTLGKNLSKRLEFMKEVERRLETEGVDSALKFIEGKKE